MTERLNADCVLDACHPGCGWNGEVEPDSEGRWTCPHCGQQNKWKAHRMSPNSLPTAEFVAAELAAWADELCPESSEDSPTWNAMAKLTVTHARLLRQAAGLLIDGTGAPR